MAGRATIWMWLGLGRGIGKVGARVMGKRCTARRELVEHVDIISEVASHLVKTMANVKPPEVDYAEIDARMVGAVKRKL